MRVSGRLLGRRVLTTFLYAVVVSSAAPRASAIDFKVEMSPQRGITTPDDEVYFDDVLSVTEAQADGLLPAISNANSNSSNALPSPVPPKNVPQRWKPAEIESVPRQELPLYAKPAEPTNNKTQQKSKAVGITRRSAQRSEMSAFPNPSCLTENVTFWKRVYAEVDVGEALIHDRDDLDKVYAVVRLGGGNAQRQQSMKMLKEHYRYSLQSLADKLNTPKQWSASEKSIAKLFRPSELTRSKLMQASENIRVQQGLKSRFDAGVRRSLQYLPTIKPILRQQKLPLDIAYLPHVESSFVNHARSKVGAVGLWQLMPQTMQLLMGKKAVNHRTDPVTATVAAAKLLKQNYERTGSWPLALTAYNHGLGGVMRAVRRTSSTDLCKIIERYNSPSFRFASSNFYAQFLAARQIALQRYAELSKNRDVNRIVAPLLASREKGAL